MINGDSQAKIMWITVYSIQASHVSFSGYDIQEQLDISAYGDGLIAAHHL